MAVFPEWVGHTVSSSISPILFVFHHPLQVKLNISKGFIKGWILLVFYVSYLSYCPVCSLQPCGHLLWKANLLCLSLFHVVPWVRCGTWLYRFLIMPSFLLRIGAVYSSLCRLKLPLYAKAKFLRRKPSVLVDFVEVSEMCWPQSIPSEMVIPIYFADWTFSKVGRVCICLWSWCRVAFGYTEFYFPSSFPRGWTNGPIQDSVVCVQANRCPDVVR